MKKLIIMLLVITSFSMSNAQDYLDLRVNENVQYEWIHEGKVLEKSYTMEDLVIGVQRSNRMIYVFHRMLEPKYEYCTLTCKFDGKREDYENTDGLETLTYSGYCETCEGERFESEFTLFDEFTMQALIMGKKVLCSMLIQKNGESVMYSWQGLRLYHLEETDDLKVRRLD